MSSESWHPPPWALPLIVVGIVVPPFLGFALGGAALGSALGFAVIVALVVAASRMRDRGPITLSRAGTAAPLLAVALAPIDDGLVANQLATLAEADPAGEARRFAILVLAPVQSTRAQRWLSDEQPGRVAAQERLAVSIATLTAAGVHAEGRVVDQDPVQALEDVAASESASRVAFVTAGPEHDALIAEMSERIDIPVHRVGPPA